MADNGTETVEELADLGTRSILAILLICVFLAVVILNCLLIFVYIRSPQLQKAPNFLFLNLVAADLLAAIFWVIPSIIAAVTSRWILGDAMCHVQGFALTICHCSNMHTFLLMSFEKALRICWPSRHRDVFYNTVVLIMIGALWLMDIVFSIFPFIGWSKLVFFLNQYQCNYDYTLSVSHLHFMFLMVYLFPVICGVVCYAALFYKVKKIQQRIDPRGNVILEENKAVPKTTYADKLKKQQDKFKYVPLKKNKPKIAEGKKSKENGYESEDMNTSSSADEEPRELWKGDDYRPRRKQQKLHNRKKRIFRYRPEVTKLAITIMIAWLVYILLWFMYYVLSYYWTFEIFNQPTDASFRALTFFTFLGLVIKVPIYVITNKRFRKFTVAAFKTDPDKKKKKEKEENTEMQTRTTKTVTVTEETTTTTTKTTVTPVWLQHTSTDKHIENDEML